MEEREFSQDSSTFFKQIKNLNSCNIELFPQRAALCRVTPAKTNEEKKYLCNFTSKTAFQKLNKLENQCVFQLSKLVMTYSLTWAGKYTA